MTDQPHQSSVDVTLYGDYSATELSTIHNTIAKGTTPEQFALFIKTCISSGLNPFLNHIYAVNYGGTMSIQISVEGILFLARKVDGFKGVDAQLVHEHDDFEAVFDENGGMKISKHTIKFPRGQVVGAYAIARRDGFPDVTILMEKNEVEKQSSSTWKNWFNDMFKKHVIKRAAKLQYGINIDEDEPSDQKSPIDVTPPFQQQSVVIEGGSAQAAQRPQPKAVQTGENETKSPEQLLAEKRAEVREKMNLCAMDEWALENFAMEKLGVLPKDMGPRELIGLSKLLDMEIQSMQVAGGRQGSLLEDLPPELS